MRTIEIVGNLNTLLTRNYDAEKGFKQAAENIEDSGLKSFLMSQAKNRYDYGHELKAMIRELGHTPEKGTSLKGNIHRIWLDLRDKLSSGDEAIIEECIRGEQAAIDDYNEVISLEILPLNLKNKLINQRNNINNTVQRLQLKEELVD